MERDPEFVMAILSEAQALLLEGDVATASILLRDLGRDLGQELLDSIRAVKRGQVSGLPQGYSLYRCVDITKLGDLSADDLELGRLYLGGLDEEGWIRITDASGEQYRYPASCFDVIDSPEKPTVATNAA